MNSSSKRTPPVLGDRSFALFLMGASAGGLAAYREIFKSLPSDFPLPILAVQHCAPIEESGLAQVLQRHCPLLVTEPEDKEPLMPGRVVTYGSGPGCQD